MLTVLAIYLVALVALAVLAPLLGLSVRGVGQRIAVVPWWAWVGGVCNLIFVVAGAVATRRIGSATFTIVTLVCAVLLSLLLDQLGIMGLEQRPATALRLLGGAPIRTARPSPRPTARCPIARSRVSGTTRHERSSPITGPELIAARTTLGARWRRSASRWPLPRRTQATASPI